MQKKIIYTGAFRFPTSDAAASRVLNNAKILRELGYDVVFISWGGHPQDADKREDGFFYYQGFRYINTYEIDVKRVNPLVRICKFFFLGRNSLRIIKQMIRNVYFVIGYDPSMFFTNGILRLCKKHDIPFISDITEWYAPNEFPGGKFAPPAWINELNMRFTQKRVCNKIVISSFLDKYYNTSHNIILPPLVDSNESKWKTILPVLPSFEGIRLIYAGTPTKKDLLQTMLDAVIACVENGMQLQFIVVGVDKENVSSYPDYNKILTFPNNILFCGKIPQTEVPSYYKVSDFSMIIREKNRKNMAGFPTKLAETLMAGCPVILNYTSDIEQYVRNEQNGLVIPGWTSIQLQKMLSEVANLSQAEIVQMKTNAMQSALDRFNYPCYINKMEAFVEKLNHHPKRRWIW
jgi:glycosyltransferase involved in cell wall biosynthesis